MSFDVKHTDKGLTASYNGVALPPLPKDSIFQNVKPENQYPYAVILPKE